MSTRTTREIRNALLGKGFKKHDTHHEVFRLWVGGKKTRVSTRLSQGAREYGDNLLALMAKQLNLRRAELDDLIDCPLSEEDYVHKLIKGQYVKLNS